MSTPTEDKMRRRHEFLDKLDQWDEKWAWNEGIIIPEEGNLPDKVIEGLRSIVAGRTVRFVYGGANLLISFPVGVFYTGKMVKRAIKCAVCAFACLATINHKPTSDKFGIWAKRYALKTCASVAIDWSIGCAHVVNGIVGVLGVIHPAIESEWRNVRAPFDFRDELNIGIEQKFTTK